MGIRLLNWVLFASSFSLVITVQSQHRNVDSLRQVLKQHYGDTNEVQTLNLLSRALLYLNIDSSGILAKKALDLSTQLNYKKGRAYAMHNLGEYFYRTGSLDSSLMYYEPALALKTAIGDSLSLLRTLNNIGVVHHSNGHYAKSLHIFEQTLQSKLKLGDTLNSATTIQNIGIIHSKQKNHELALQYYERALKIQKRREDLDGQACILLNIAEVYLNQEDFSTALTHLQAAYQAFNALGVACRTLMPMVYIGLCYKELNEPDSALKYLRLSNNYAPTCQNPYINSKSLLGMGEVYKAKGMHKKAEEKMLSSYLIAKQHDFKNEMESASSALYNHYKSIGNVSQSIIYLEISSRLKDELIDKELTEQLTTIELNYAFERERDSLEFQKQAQLLTINTQLEQQRTFQYIIILSFFVTLIFGFVIYRNYWLKQVAHVSLQKKNDMQKEKLKLEENIRKQLEIENNQKARSLTATSIQLLNFNEKLSDVINLVNRNVALPGPLQLKVKEELEELRNVDNNWVTIKFHFGNVHPDFFQKLEEQFPNLTPNDHKLMALLKMKLSNKEIATILNVTRRAVEQSKRRLKKKLGMDSESMDIFGYINKQTESYELLK